MPVAVVTTCWRSNSISTPDSSTSAVLLSTLLSPLTLVLLIAYLQR